MASLNEWTDDLMTDAVGVTPGDQSEDAEGEGDCFAERFDHGGAWDRTPSELLTDLATVTNDPPTPEARDCFEEVCASEDAEWAG